MAKPRLQHSGGELRAVADLIDALQGFANEYNDIGLKGELTVYWSDVPMGSIVRDDDVWVYYPEAEDRTETERLS